MSILGKHIEVVNPGFTDFIRKPRGPLIKRAGGPEYAWLFRDSFIDFDGKGLHPTLVGSPVITPEGYYFNTGVSYLNYGTSLAPRTWAGAFTLIVKASLPGSGVLYSFDDVNPNLSTVITGLSNGGAICTISGNGTSTVFASIGAGNLPFAGSTGVGGFRFIPSTSLSIFAASGKVAENVTSIPASIHVSGTAPLKIGATLSGSSVFTGRIHFVYWWPEALTDAQITQIINNPYEEVFSSPIPRVFVSGFTGLVTATATQLGNYLAPVITPDGLVSTTASTLADFNISVSIPDATVSATTSLIGAGEVGIYINDTLNTTISSLVSDSPYTLVTTNPGLVAVQADSISSPVVFGFIAPSGLVSASATALGDDSISTVVATTPTSINASAFGGYSVSASVQSGLVGATGEALGNSKISARVENGLTSTLSSFQGTSQVSVFTSEGLVSLSTDQVANSTVALEATMLGDFPVFDYRMPDGLVGTNAEMLGAFNEITVDGLFSAVATMSGQQVIENPPQAAIIPSEYRRVVFVLANR